MPLRRPVSSLLILLSLSLLVTGAAKRTRAELDADFVVKFTKYVRWPIEAFTGDEDPFVIGALGKKGVERELRRHARKHNASARKNGRRQVEIRRISPGTTDAESLSRFHIIYIADDHEKYVPQLLDGIERRPTLLVSPIENFAETYGGIELREVEHRVKLVINHKSVTDRNLEPAAKFLKICIVVGG